MRNESAQVPLINDGSSVIPAWSGPLPMNQSQKPLYFYVLPYICICFTKKTPYLKGYMSFQLKCLNILSELVLLI